MHDDRSRLREALATALAAAQDACAPERVIALLRGAYRSLESAHFVDADMIQWAEASLGAWRRWSAARDQGQQRLLVVDAAGEVADAVRAAARIVALGTVGVVTTRNAALEALATHPPAAIVFDLDGELAPTTELLEWLSTEFPNIRRIGCTSHADPFVRPRDRALYGAIIGHPPSVSELEDAILSLPERLSSLG
jgi:hypothetical protein